VVSSLALTFGIKKIILRRVDRECETPEGWWRVLFPSSSGSFLCWMFAHKGSFLGGGVRARNTHTHSFNLSLFRFLAFVSGISRLSVVWLLRKSSLCVNGYRDWVSITHRQLCVVSFVCLFVVCLGERSPLIY